MIESLYPGFRDCEGHITMELYHAGFLDCEGHITMEPGRLLLLHRRGVRVCACCE